MARTKSILLISTGGTISGEVSGNQDEKTSAQTFDDNIGHVKKRILEKWFIDIQITSKALKDKNDADVNIDSSNITPEHWTLLTKFIVDHYDEYDSFIITHGTNTLGYTSSALSFAFQNINKPIIITGSQVPFGWPGSDALTNLDNSLRVAAWPYNELKGVFVVFGSSIISGTKAKKNTEFDYDAFKSFTSTVIGNVGRIISMDEEQLEIHNKFYSPSDLDVGLTKADLVVDYDFSSKVISITETPGMDPEIFRLIAEERNVEGFILRAFGAGDASKRLLPALRYLKENKIPIIITTQAPNGNANLQVNNPGQDISKEKLGVPAYNMSMESQVTKLAWLLSKYKDLEKEARYNKVLNDLGRNFKGEIKKIKEKNQ